MDHKSVIRALLLQASSMIFGRYIIIKCTANVIGPTTTIPSKPFTALLIRIYSLTRRNLLWDILRLMIPRWISLILFSGPRIL